MKSSRRYHIPVNARVMAACACNSSSMRHNFQIRVRLSSR